MYICQLTNRKGTEVASDMYEFFLMNNLYGLRLCLLNRHSYTKEIDTLITRDVL